MNILERIKDAEKNFTKSDKLIYDSIKDDYSRIIREASTIVDFANKCNVSKSAVLRFAKKLGYSGFSELKYNFTLIGHSSIPTELHESKFNYILESYSETIRSIHQFLKEEDFIQLAQMITSNDKIRICGYNRSSLSAAQFKYRLLQIRIESELITDTLTLSTMLESFRKQELFIFFTVRGNASTPLNAAIKSCHDSNKQVVIVTMNPNCSYKKYADKFILLPNIKAKGIFIDEQAVFHIFIEILISYASEQVLKK